MFSETSIPVLGPTQLSLKFVLRTLSVRVMRPGRDAKHLPPSSVDIKNEWSYTFTTFMCLRGVYRDDFTFTLLEL